MIGKAVCIRQAALINARRRSLNEWKAHINDLKDAQVMKSCIDRIRNKEEADSSKKTGSLSAGDEDFFAGSCVSAFSSDVLLFR